MASRTLASSDAQRTGNPGRVERCAGDYATDGNSRGAASPPDVSGAAPSLASFVPARRLALYRNVVGTDSAALEAFYIWSQEVSFSLFRDIGALEVAMRSAMARELVSEFGIDWYSSSGDLFDDDALRSLSTAWRQAGLQALSDDPAVGADVVEGKLVAATTFGFWVQLLGKGSYCGKQPFRQRRIYDTLLWKPALSKAFPLAPSRRDTERKAYLVQTTRNRIAHHEHIIWAIPLPGQGRRVAVTDALGSLLDLAGYLSLDTRSWIESHSGVQRHLADCPVDPTLLRLT